MTRACLSRGGSPWRSLGGSRKIGNALDLGVEWGRTYTTGANRFVGHYAMKLRLLRVVTHRRTMAVKKRDATSSCIARELRRRVEADQAAEQDTVRKEKKL